MFRIVLSYTMFRLEFKKLFVGNIWNIENLYMFTLKHRISIVAEISTHSAT